MSDDLISRQEAIDRINKQREHLEPDVYPQDKIADAAYRICAEFIERLPSAQPEVRTEMSSANDTISRQAAIDEVINLWADKPFGNPALVEIKDCIEALPSAQPKQRLIPCEKCWHGCPFPIHAERKDDE